MAVFTPLCRVVDTELVADYIHPVSDLRPLVPQGALPHLGAEIDQQLHLNTRRRILLRE